VQIIQPPRVEQRPEKTYLGIRIVTPWPGVLPAGGYATLTYVDHARRANKALIEWARDNGVAFDRWDEPSGDAFACRYEAYITDPRTEPRKTKWEVELNMRVA
jgi:hypothetical protein